MLEPLSISAYAVELVQIKPGHSVAVVGCGPIGLLTMEVANASGAALCFSTDTVSERVRTASRIGATYPFNDNGAHAYHEISDATHFTRTLGREIWRQRNSCQKIR